MEYCENYEEQILQSEKFNMSVGTVVRVQILENSYVVSFIIDTDMYKNLRLNTFKRGIRISSTLKKFPKKKISEKIVLTKDFVDFSQLKEDSILIENKYYTMNIIIKFSDFLRGDVKTYLRKAILEKNEIAV